MIAQYEMDRVLKMFSPEELQIVAIRSGAQDGCCPPDYLLYGEEITRYSVALTALRDLCDDITRRSRTGIVMPRVIVRIDDPYALIMRCPDGEIANLLDTIAVHGKDCGIELKKGA